MGDKIIQIFPHTDTKGLDEIIAEQDAYYGREPAMTVRDMEPGMAEKISEEYGKSRKPSPGTGMTVTGRITNSEPKIQNIPGSLADKLDQLHERGAFNMGDKVFPIDKAAMDAAYTELSTEFGEAPVDTSKMIFVFGSNLAGIHGAGAAKYALKNRGAVWGEGVGHHGQSFALPTKNQQIQSMHLHPTIREWVDHFLAYARHHPELAFQVTAIGCGLAGFKHHEIAPMFIGAPDNCYFDELWKPWLDNVKFWGTF